MRRKVVGYLLIGVSLVGGIYMVFVTFQQWLDSGSPLQLLIDAAILMALLVIFVLGYSFATAMDVPR